MSNASDSDYPGWAPFGKWHHCAPQSNASDSDYPGGGLHLISGITVHLRVMRQTVTTQGVGSIW